jgi:hypothetical protein
MSNTVEVIWLQVHLPHLKSIREAAIDNKVLTVSIWITCEMLDNVCDINREVCFLCDLNIDWLSSSCPLKKKL